MVPVREIFINLGICGKKKGQYVSTRKNWYLYPPKNDVAILLVEQAEDVIVPYKIFSLVKEYMKFDGNSAVWLPLSKFDIDLTNKHQWIKQEIFQEEENTSWIIETMKKESTMKIMGQNGLMKIRMPGLKITRTDIIRAQMKSNLEQK